MKLQTITDNERKAYNNVVSHPLQSFEWGEFRERTGVKVIRKGIFDNDKLISGFTITLHPVPHTPYLIGYLPKGELPNEMLIHELKKIGKEEKCIFVQLEPNSIRIKNPTGHRPPAGTRGLRGTFGQELRIKEFDLVPAAHPLFTKYTFILDLTKSEEELLKNMHPKARYNIRVAKKHEVEIVEENSLEAFEQYWQLTQETTQRQNFYAHTKNYHKLQWQTFSHTPQKNELSSHLFLAKYQHKVLAAWILFVFKDTLYYPYGASSNEHREVMASNLIMWEAIRFGKKLNLQKFDMWGALGPNPDTNDPWFGFHNFKQKYGATLTEFVGSYDLVINPVLYQGYKYVDKLRWLMLRMKK